MRLKSVDVGVVDVGVDVGVGITLRMKSVDVGVIDVGVDVGVGVEEVEAVDVVLCRVELRPYSRRSQIRTCDLRPDSRWSMMSCDRRPDSRRRNVTVGDRCRWCQ